MKEIELAGDEAANATMANVEGKRTAIVRPPDVDVERGERLRFVQNGNCIGEGEVTGVFEATGQEVRDVFSRADARYPTDRDGSLTAPGEDSFAAGPNEPVRVIVFAPAMR